MALITRISRLFQADFHAVLDHLEEPHLLLRHAVREMQEQLLACQRHIDGLQRGIEQLQQREIQAKALAARCDEEIALSFAGGGDDLARGVIRKKLQTEQNLQAIDRRRDTLQRELQTQQAWYRENSARLDSMRQKAQLLEEEQRVESVIGAGGSDPYGGGTDHSIDDNAVELALLREKQRYCENAAGAGPGREKS